MKNIENWTHQNRCECKLPVPFDESIPYQVLECLRELTVFREAQQSPEHRFKLLSKIGVDANIFQSAHFSSFGFPHVLEHATLDFDDLVEWKNFIESRTLVLNHWVFECLENAHLDIFVVERNGSGVQVCSLLTGKRAPLHLSFFDVPLSKDDYFIGRLFETADVNFVTFPFLLSKEDAIGQATQIQNIYAKLDQKLTLKSFMKTLGSVPMLSFMVEEFNALLEADVSLSKLSHQNLNALQKEFASLSKQVENVERCTFEGFTSQGWMYAFAPRALPELHIYFDANARQMMLDGGSFKSTKGCLSLYWLPKDAVGYSSLIGTPNWCVALTRRGLNMVAEDPKNSDAQILVQIIKRIKKELTTQYDVAA